MNIEVIDYNGKLIEHTDILTFFKIDNSIQEYAPLANKNYVFYTLNEIADQNSEDPIYRMYVANTDMSSEINDDEWNLLKKIMVSITKDIKLSNITYIPLNDESRKIVIGQEPKQITVKKSKIDKFKDNQIKQCAEQISNSHVSIGNYVDTEVIADTNEVVEENVLNAFNSTFTPVEEVSTPTDYQNQFDMLTGTEEVVNVHTEPVINEEVHDEQEIKETIEALTNTVSDIKEKIVNGADNMNEILESVVKLQESIETIKNQTEELKNQVINEMSKSQTEQISMAVAQNAGIETVTQAPVSEATLAPEVMNTVVETPVVEQFVQTTPVMENPVTTEPVQAPVVEQFVQTAPVMENPVTTEPVQAPVVEQFVQTAPVMENPVTIEPVQAPVAETTFVPETITTSEVNNLQPVFDPTTMNTSVDFGGTTVLDPLQGQVLDTSINTDTNNYNNMNTLNTGVPTIDTATTNDVPYEIVTPAAPVVPNNAGDATIIPQESAFPFIEPAAPVEPLQTEEPAFVSQPVNGLTQINMEQPTFDEVTSPDLSELNLNAAPVEQPNNSFIPPLDEQVEGDNVGLLTDNAPVTLPDDYGRENANIQNDDLRGNILAQENPVINEFTNAQIEDAQKSLTLTPAA